MTLNENNNIGFKLFMAFIILGGAILFDLLVFGAISEFDISKFFEEMFDYTVDHTNCNVTLTHHLSLNDRYLNMVRVEEGEEFINTMFNELELYDVFEYGTSSDEDYDYVINSCNTIFKFSKDSDIAEYDEQLLNISDYKDSLIRVVDKAMAQENLPRIYTVDRNYEDTELYPTYFTDQDTSDIMAYWGNLPKTPVYVDLAVIGRYHFVIGNNVVYFDNLEGYASYNGSIIMLSDDILTILDNYI